MAILGFTIGALLTALGFGSLVMAINLVPTEMGLTYALSGVIFIGCGGISLTVAALIARIDRISSPKRPPPAKPEEAPAAAPPPAPAAEEDEVNLNRSGHLPSLRAVEEAILEPEPAPEIVGRYAAGGANYVIFSDGSIEAETEGGGYRFASMTEFKEYLANRKA
jgi:hypothetical protein